MKLESLANLGELTGGIAVIASLTYLAVQIRQDTQSVRSSTIATNTANWSSLPINLARGLFDRPLSEVSEEYPFRMLHQWQVLANKRKAERAARHP